MLNATLRSFLAHKGRLLLSALAVVLSVAFVVQQPDFSDTVTRTFDRLFASTAADVTVSPKNDLKSRVADRRHADAARLARGPAREGRRRGGHPMWTRSVENLTIVDRDNKSIGPTSGAPTIATNWQVTKRSPVKLTSGHAPHGADEALLDADTAQHKHVAIGDTLTVQASAPSR